MKFTDKCSSLWSSLIFEMNSMSNRRVAEGLIIVSLILVAILINLFPVPFFTGSAFVFGNIVAVALTVTFGLSVGLFASFIAGLVTYLSWGHLLVVPPFLLEVVIVHWAIKHKKSPLLYGTAYWLSAGWCIVAAEYLYFTSYLDVTKSAIVIKYLVNGVINILLGYLLAFILLTKLKGRKIPQLTMSQFITQVVFFSVFLSVITNSYYWLRSTQQNKLEQLTSQLQLEVDHVSGKVAGFLNQAQSSLSILADLETAEADKNLTNRLEIVALRHPNFLTMLATDKDGNVVASFPQQLLELAGNNLNVSDRSYFYLAKESMQPVVSEVFRGRGFGNDPIVAVSSPIIDKGEFQGVVEASLNLSEFALLDHKSITSTQSLIILDSQHRVIYASKSLNMEFLQDVSASSMLQYLQTEQSYFYINERGDYQIARRQFVEGANWSVISLIPREYYERKISTNVAVSWTILAAFIIVFFFIASRVATMVSRPITDIAKSISDASEKNQFEFLQLKANNTAITELSEMAPIIQRFARKLQKTLSQLQDANAQTQKANDELETLNQSLTDRVLEKTQELQVALNEANHAKRAKSFFLATMSHEIRTPMNGVIGMLELLRTTDLSTQQKQQVEVAESSAKALLSLINDILDLSKLDAGKLGFEIIDFDLVRLLKEVTEAQRLSVAKPDVEITCDDLAYEKVWLKGDPYRVRQIIFNLMSNAVKFTSQGRVSLGCQIVEFDNRVQVTLIVTDTGIGIESEKLPSLFDPFTQADASTTRQYGGTGLGLSIVKQLCELMGGEVSVSSEPGVGSQFIAMIFLEKGEKPALEQPHPENIEPISLDGLNVLLVEDNLVNQTVAKKMLQKLGCNVEIAGNGQQALDKMQQDDSLQVVLMDCQMPVMDGFEATRNIRSGNVGRTYQDIVIVALTANAMKGDKEACFDAGMDLFLPKPLTLDKLKHILIESQQYVRGPGAGI